ncbi:hypothetical protein jhhlp_008410 [Lomentospora prolificans]|uniref:Cytochrome P450 n=1 Tax=Lomentospora prolificans TaxID=41688 RepID=A0A2N3MXZ1_9PEZI|nr:hypothetical protein jhhlp_008410 [Lomentospora prolificans]
MTLLNLSLPQATLISISLPLLGFLLHTLLQQPIRRDSKPLPKAPNTLPLLGNALHFLRPRHELLGWFVACQRKHGNATLQISVPTVGKGVIISDPKNVEFVLKNEGVFAKGDFVKSRSWDLFGYGIINADGDLWKAQRRAGLAFLSAANLRVLTEVALPKYLGESVEELRGKADGETVVDMQGVFHEVTTRLMGKMAYDMEMHANDDFTLAFEYASGATAARFQNPLWKITEIFLGSKFRRALGLVRSHGRQIVESATKSRDSEKTPKDGKLDEISGSLVKSLLDSIGDEKLVADSALNYLSAGRDTTAQGLTWTLHLLTRHPEEASKMRREIRRILQTAEVSPSYPFTIKQTTAPSTLPDGTFLPRGSVLLWSPWSMNRSRITWGPDADSFRPTRWLSFPDGQDETGDAIPRFVNRPVGEFPVFNGGPRICLGKKMAELMAVQVLAVVVWLFDFVDAAETGPGGVPAEKKSPISLTLPMEGGLPCFVSLRSYAEDWDG